MKENIILIGMPGVGKSTIGVVLAKVLGYQFIDTDLVIQEKEGKQDQQPDYSSTCDHRNRWKCCIRTECDGTF